MADFIKLGQSITQHLAQKLGSNVGVKYSISGKELEDLVLSDTHLFDFLTAQGLIGQKNLTLDVLTQAKSNYSIASINIRNKSSSLLSGFYSSSNDGVNKVEKYHFSDKKEVYSGYKDLKSKKDNVSKNTTIPYTAKDLIEKCKQGFNIKDLSRIYKKATSTLNLLLPKEYKFHGHLSKEDINLIQELGNQGLSASEISQKYGYNVATVRSYLPKEQKNGNNISEETSKKINDLSQKGHTIDEISKACDVGLSTVRRHIKDKSGIPSRSDVKITEEIIEQIKQMYLQGATQAQIGKKFGLSRGSVYRYIPKELKKSKELSQEMIDKINELGATGISARQIARELGISQFAVNKYISPEFKKQKGTPKEIIEKIRQLHSQGWSAKAIAKECGVGENIVFKYRVPKQGPDKTSPLYKKINNLRSKGVSVDEIAQQCKVSRATVYNYLDSSLKQGDEITKEVEAEINKMRRQGFSPDEIAQKFGISRASVFNHLDEDLKYNWKISDELHEKINNLRKSGLTTRQIAKECEISCSSVLNHLAEDIKPKQRINLISEDELRQELASGKSIYEIADSHDMNPVSVWHTMKRFGIRSERSIQDEFIESSMKKYEQYNNEELKNRFFEAYTELYDKFSSDSELCAALDKIADEMLNNTISFETRNNLISFIRKLDLAQRNIVSNNQILKSEDFIQMKRWADKAGYVENLNNQWLFILKEYLPQEGYKDISKILEKYEIKSIDDPNIKIIENYIDKISSSENLKKDIISIKRQEIYLHTSDKLLKSKAENFAKNADGSIDTEKAGQYLMNLQALKNPKSAETSYPKEFIEIVAKEKYPENLSVNYLIKLDNYFSEHDDYLMEDFCKIFDKKDRFETKLVKNFYLKNYIEFNSSILTKGDNNRIQESVFASKAKKEIHKYYGYPNCLRYTLEFENAMKSFSPDDGKSGIKTLEGNHYSKTEVKVRKKAYRLLSSNGNNIYDEFDPTGLH